MARDKILLLGASSFIGRPLFNKLGAKNTIGTYRSRPFKNGVFFDSINTSLLDVIKAPDKVSHAIILLGIVRPDVCARDALTSQRVNVDSVIEILKQLKSWNIKPVYASSESIFDGTKGNYSESDPPSPILIYGRQKVQIEAFIRENYDDYVILRIATVVGNSSNDGTILANWHNQIINNENIKSAIDQVKTPIFIGDLIKAIDLIVKDNLIGTYNVGGRNACSAYELSGLLLKEAETFSAVGTDIIGVSIDDFRTIEKRPRDVSLNSDKLWRKLGIKPKDMATVCRELVSTYFGQQ